MLGCADSHPTSMANHSGWEICPLPVHGQGLSFFSTWDMLVQVVQVSDAALDAAAARSNSHVPALGNHTMPKHSDLNVRTCAIDTHVPHQ